MKRPLLPVALLYVGGVLVSDWVPLSPWVLLGASLGLSALALVSARGREALLYAAAVGAGWTNCTLHTAILSPYDLRRVLGEEPEIVTVRGILREAPVERVFEVNAQESWRTLARVDVTALRRQRQDWQRAAGRLAVSTRGLLSTNIFAGQTVEITGVAALPKIAVAEGLFDYRAYLREQGTYYHLEAASEADWQVVASPRGPPVSDRFRAWARRALAIGLPAEDESLRLEWALTLGWKTALTEEVAEPFVQAATYHIFAVDGLRMAILFGIFFGLLRVLSVPRAICGLLLLPAIWGYTMLTGWPASAIRASVMLTVIIIGWVLKRPSDLLNSLLAAALIILLWEPRQLYQAGFQLSFCVVLCMILILPVLRGFGARLFEPDPLLPADLQPRWRSVLRLPAGFAGGLFLTSLAAWLGSVPLVAYYFNIVTLISTPANIVAVPLCALVLICDFSSLLLAGWFPGGAALFNHAGWFWMECIRVSSHWFANWPRAFFYVPAPGLFTTALYYAVLLTAMSGWLFAPKLRACKTAALAAAVGLWGWHCLQECSITRLTVLPANGGMAVLFDAPGVRNDLLVDCGATNSVQALMKPFLRAQGVNRLPALVLTHGDAHHVGGAELLTNLFATEKVCASPVRARSPVYRRILSDLGATPARLRTVSRGDPLGAWTVLHPEPTDHFAQADDNAVVLSGRIRGTPVLLLSDLGRPGQDALLERHPGLRADIVVTGLPSRGEPVCDAFLDAVRPRVVVVADSEFPAYERASPKLQTRLAQRKLPVIYTREEGATTIEWRGNAWELRTRSGKRIGGGPGASPTFGLEVLQHGAPATGPGGSRIADSQ
ncbi:MAG TPA: ComEC/Rec2 family competence protein [Candidatus Acidoferrum sp.]|nr:ComEC/Rec2 family competence protein [Candidatus Acidoferrum sp.]